MPVCLVCLVANEEMMRRLATLPLAGIEVHCEKSDYDAVQRLMTLTRFKCRNAIVEVQCGYLIHRKAAEVTNADIAFERATRCVAALLGDAGPCGGKRLSPITHTTTGVHKAQGVRTALHNRPAPPSRA